MTKRERVKAAIGHREPDKVPTFFHLAPDGLGKYGESLWEIYGREDMRRLHAEGKLGYRNSLYYSMGNHVCFLENFPWWDWKSLPPEYRAEDTPDFIPRTVDFGSLEVFGEAVRNLREYTDAYILAEVWTSDFEKAYFSRGLEYFLADMAAEPGFARELLDFITEKNLSILKEIVRTPGLDGVLLGNDWGSQRGMLMSPEMWKTMLRPGAKREYDLIRSAGLDVWVHSCGDIRPVLPELAAMGADVLNPVQPECMDTFELKRLYGSGMTFWGGISTQRTLPYGSPEEVRAETVRVTESMAAGGGYIIAAAQGIQADVPLQNLRALVDTANAL